MNQQPHNSDNADASNIKDAFDSLGNLGPLLATGAFQTLMRSSGCLSISVLEAAIALLIKARIGFDLEYSGGNNRSEPKAILTIFITPTVSISFEFHF